MDIVLLKNHRGEDVPALLLMDVSAEVLIEADRHWHNFKAAAQQASSDRNELLPESHEWNWGTKFHERKPSDRFLAIERDNAIQGFLQLDILPRKSERVRGTTLLYIDYIEVATWNQPLYAGEQHRRFGRVGYNLLVAAGLASISAGCNGLLALHSLPESESFYPGFELQGRKMFHLLGGGFDPYPELSYFESALE